MTRIVPGVCRYCGCTADASCRLPSGEACCWMDSLRTLCSGPACLRAFYREPKRKQPKRLTTADVHAQIRARKRGKRE